jgi:hypothetical protein
MYVNSIQGAILCCPAVVDALQAVASRQKSDIK